MSAAVTSLELVSRYRTIRARSRRIFEILTEDAYYDQPISLRHPIVFYEGHLPVFAVNTLIKLGLHRRGIDEGHEKLFERGIDPETAAGARGPDHVWPARKEVQQYATAAEAMVVDALSEDVAGFDAVAREAVGTILEHEVMHHETLLYMFHQLPYEKKRRQDTSAGPARSPVRGESKTIGIPSGIVTLGADRGQIEFGWDNEFPLLKVDVTEFEIDRFPVSNADYLHYMQATGEPAPHFWARKGNDWFWRSMFELEPLQADGPVFVTKDQADRYARWKGRRLPAEAEYHRAAYGTPSGEERLHPWGDAAPAERHGNFDFVSWDPVPSGSYPDGASAWGVEDLVGNGWEWTSTVFAPFPGFKPMPTYQRYSADFFDGKHFVLKGASPATGRDVIRRSFRNWFRPNYPYVYAKFRCVK